MPISSRRISSLELSHVTWDAFVDASPQGHVDCLVGYMDIIHPGWEALVIEEKGKWLGIMPLPVRKKGLFLTCRQPIFAQQQGLLFAPDLGKNTYEVFSKKKKIVQEVIEQLEEFEWTEINFGVHFDYALPFYNAGYRLESRFTYHIDLRKSEIELQQEFASPLLRQIRKAEESEFQLSVTNDALELMKLIRLQGQAGKDLIQGKESSLGILNQLCNWLGAHERAEFLYLTNEEGEILAGLCLVFHQQTCHYLIGAYHPEFKQSGAMSALMWEGIRHAKSKEYTVFDFEGSMKPQIESFFRKFGATPVTYTHISRNFLPKLIQWMQELRS